MSITFKPLVWSEIREPDKECRYNHCEAQTPFGHFAITWKGWKENSGFAVDETPWGCWGGVFLSLEEAKACCEQLWREQLMMCIQEAAS